MMLISSTLHQFIDGTYIFNTQSDADDIDAVVSVVNIDVQISA